MRYRWGTGLSRPWRSTLASTVAWLLAAPSPSAAVIGSPGTRVVRAKVTMVTPIISRIEVSRRRTMYAASGHRCRGRRSEERDLVSRSEEHTSELQSRFDLVCRL